MRDIFKGGTVKLEFHGSRITSDAGLLAYRELDEILGELKIRRSNITKIKNELEGLRSQIDKLDDAVIEHLATRMNVAEKIGEFKRDNDVTILQVNRWDEIVHNRISMAKVLGLSEDFIEGLLKLIHTESIRRQNEVMNREVAK